MMVQVRRCCCNLMTFTTLLSSLLTTFHLCLLIGCSIWYNLFSHQSDARQKKSLLTTDDLDPVREVNDDNYESFVRGSKHFASPNEDYARRRGEVTFETVVYVILLVVAVLGAIVNVMVVVALKLNRRWLFLPWLVFHLMGIMACFAGGIYLALHYTLLQSEDHKLEDQALAIVSLFPIVGGIFLIFLWVLFDQTFITMGRSNKNLDETNESIHTSSTSVNNKSVSNSTLISNYGSNLINTPDFPDNLIIGTLKSPKTGIERRKSNDKHIYAKTQSLPRSSKGRRHKIKEFSVNLDMNLLKMKKAKSLEQILDGGSSNSSIGGTPNVWVADRKSSRTSNLSRNDSTTDLRRKPARRSSSFDDILTGTLVEIKQQQQQPTYYTVDRRSRNGQPHLSTFVSPGREGRRRPSSAVPTRSSRRDYDNQNDLYGGAPPPAPLRHSRRSRSAEYLLETDLKPMQNSRAHVSTTYLSAWDNRDLEIRPKSNLEFTRSSNRDYGTRYIPNRSGSSADTVRSTQSVKSVTIAPKVTEFHYTEELDASMSEPDLSNRFYVEEMTDNGLVPDPIFPTTPVPPPLPHTKHQSWLNKFSPIKPKTGYTRDQIIEYYCSNGDVAL